MALDQRPQAGDQVSVAGLQSPTAPTGWRGIAVAGPAHESTRLALAQPPLAGVMSYFAPGCGGRYFLRKTSLIT